MKKLLFASILSLNLLFIACKKEESSSGPTTSKDAIVGTWVSEGNNVAIGLRMTLKTKKIVATFNENKTYTVVATDSNNVSVTYTGTYQSAGVTDTLIHPISLNQQTPVALQSQGIYQIKGNTMTYEVIQVNPPIQGFTPPTVQEGFGSTKYNGIALGPTWVQVFVKQ
ncbi:MAG: hypothetical protein ACPL25_05455 [Ignavibacteria bacterium]